MMIVIYIVKPKERREPSHESEPGAGGGKPCTRHRGGRQTVSRKGFRRRRRRRHHERRRADPWGLLWPIRLEGRPCGPGLRANARSFSRALGAVGGGRGSSRRDRGLVSRAEPPQHARQWLRAVGIVRRRRAPA